LVACCKANRVPAHVHIHAEFVQEKPLTNEDLADHGFWHVEVWLDPHAAHRLPAPFADALLNLGELSRIFVAVPFAVANARLRVYKNRVFVQLLQGGAKSVADDFDGLLPRPEPGHVDVGIANQTDSELLHPAIDRLHVLLSDLQRTAEGCLIAVIESREVNIMDGFVELETFLLPVGRAADGGFRCPNSAADNTGVRLIRMVLQGFAAQKAASFVMKREPDCNLKDLSGGGLFGQGNWIESADLTLSHKAAVDEDAAVGGEAHRKAQLGSGEILSGCGRRNPEAGALPALGCSGLECVAGPARVIERDGRP
jgi:hypothetical protein